MTQCSLMVVDANVWLDYLLGRRANHESAQNFIVEVRWRDLDESALQESVPLDV